MEKAKVVPRGDRANANTEVEDSTPLERLTKQLKNNLEAVEMLRSRRAYLMELLSRENASDSDHECWSSELAKTNAALNRLDDDRLNRILPSIENVPRE